MVPFPIPQVNGMGWERELRGGNDTLGQRQWSVPS